MRNCWKVLIIKLYIQNGMFASYSRNVITAIQEINEVIEQKFIGATPIRTRKKK